MELPADRSTRTAVPQPQAGVREAGRARWRRRPTGEPPPLPHHLQTSGVRWLVAMVVLLVLALGAITQRPRPFGVVIREGRGGWAMPSLQVMLFAAGLVAVLYTLVPEAAGGTPASGW